MKEIIKHGNKKMIFECSCGCIFYAGYKDVSRDWITASECRITTTCPECNNLLYFKKENECLIKEI